MAADTASWSIPNIAATNLHDAVVEFENTNREQIETARAENKSGIWFVLTNDLKTIMQNFIHVGVPLADEFGHG